MRFQVFLSLWSVTSCLCIEKIPDEVAKTKVSKPKRYSLSKLRLWHAPLKWLIQTRPHMSTSPCGNICIMQPKCSRKERRRGFSNRSSVDAGSHVRETMCVSMRKQKHFIGCLHMTSLLWREMQLEGRKWFFSIGISSRNSRCLCFAIFINAQSVKPRKHKEILSCTKMCCS